MIASQEQNEVYKTLTCEGDGSVKVPLQMAVLPKPADLVVTMHRHLPDWAHPEDPYLYFNVHYLDKKSVGVFASANPKNKKVDVCVCRPRRLRCGIESTKPAKGSLFSFASRRTKVVPGKAFPARTDEDVKNAEVRCNIRFHYNKSTGTFSFNQDAEYRTPYLAALMGMEHVPAMISSQFATMEDLLYVYIAYIVGEERKPHLAVIRSANYWRHKQQKKISSGRAGKSRLAKREKAVMHRRAELGLESNDSDGDITTDVDED
jgi:hypothetical protein